MAPDRELPAPALRGAALVREGMRAEMVAGRLLPGAMLPSHLALARRYRVSTGSVLQALAQLAGQGFVTVRPRVGTMVVDRPPYLHDYALVFCADPSLPPPLSGRPWTQHYVALAAEAQRLQQETGRHLLVFHGIDEHADTEDRARLTSYLETHRVAGVIFTSAPFLLHGSPILTLPGIARVAITAEPIAGVPSVVVHQVEQWRTKALDWFVALGRRRVASLGLGRPGGAPHDAAGAVLQRAITERGMVSRPRWQQLASLRNTDSARRIAELLMNDRERPDALLITDDHFVEPALAGILAAGVRVPEDLAIVAHANFPCAPACALPARLLGYDTGAILRACMDSIDDQRGGQLVHARIPVAPLWEEEYQSPAIRPVDRVQEPGYQPRR